MAWKRGLVARSCASTGREDVVREVKGIEKVSILVREIARGTGLTGSSNYAFRCINGSGRVKAVKQ